MPNWRLRRNPVLGPKNNNQRKTPTQGQGFSLVDLARENWNYLFDDLVVLCERLEELDIEKIMIAQERIH